jgi:hypothetical protein
LHTNIDLKTTSEFSPILDLTLRQKLGKNTIRNKLKTNALCQYAQRYKLICTRMIIIEKEREER